MTGKALEGGGEGGIDQNVNGPIQIHTRREGKVRAKHDSSMRYVDSISTKASISDVDGNVSPRPTNYRRFDLKQTIVELAKGSNLTVIDVNKIATRTISMSNRQLISYSLRSLVKTREVICERPLTKFDETQN